jgi:hypothetical protein
LSPFSATIVQNTSNLRNDWDFATAGCIGIVQAGFSRRISNRKPRKNAGWLWHASGSRSQLGFKG